MIMISCRKAFTLIELLVVIGILAILAAILLPAINTAMKKGEMAQARADAKGLVTAWKSYYAEYGYWPVNKETNFIMASNHVDILLGSHSPNSFSANPKQVRFMEAKNESFDSKMDFVDPWGTAYRVKFDYDHDNKVTSVPGNQSVVYEGVVAWSAGADGEDGTIGDNITSWE